MKIAFLPIIIASQLLTKYRESWAFSTKPFASFGNVKSLRLSATVLGTGIDIIRQRDNVLEIAQNVFKESPTGVFITDSVDKSNLKKAVARLEAITDAPTNPEKLKGCWKLICTTNSAGFLPLPKDSFNIPFLSPYLLKENLRNNAKVFQRIWNEKNTTSEVFDRVDNIIEITSDGLIAPFLNPLEVTKTKFSLIHKVESNTYPVLRTKIALQKIVVTVAGKSQYLDVNGSDVFGINIPLGDVLNSGSFETTYVDEKIRVSRGTLPFLDEVRVFMKVQDGILEEESSNFAIPTANYSAADDSGTFAATFQETTANSTSTAADYKSESLGDAASKFKEPYNEANTTSTTLVEKDRASLAEHYNTVNSTNSTSREIDSDSDFHLK